MGIKSHLGDIQKYNIFQYISNSCTIVLFLLSRTERLCASDSKIGNIDIKKGINVQIPIHAIHYDPKIWPEPEKFNPYRFTSEEKAKHGPYDWIPFGSGPRNCVAMRLAQVELKIGVAYLIRAYKFVRCERTEVSCAGTDQIKIFFQARERSNQSKIRQR